MLKLDRSKSLQELEGRDWGEPPFDSYVVTNSHRLARVPLQEFTIEDLRFMIGQQIGLDYLIPVALEHLRNDPLAEGDCYCGDLLVSVLRADSRFWIKRSTLRSEIARVAEEAMAHLPTLEESEQTAVRDAYGIFQRAEYFAEHGRA